MAMNKNTVLAWATTIMIIVGLGLIAMGAFKYEEVAGWGFAAVGIGFFCHCLGVQCLKREGLNSMVYRLWLWHE
jgi:hypothetical protein